MLSIGIGGQIGTGKTYVAQQLIKLLHKDGYRTMRIDADQIAWSLYQLNTPVYKKIVRVFGKDVLQANKEIDRSKLADKVFTHKKNLQHLNQIVHPALIKHIKSQLQSNNGNVKILDAALLFFWGKKIPIGYRILVTAPLQEKIARMKKRGYRAQAVKERLRQQMKESEMKKSADFVIHNNSNLTKLNKKIKNLYQILKEISKL